jgi:uncharacterized membrane protein
LNTLSIGDAISYGWRGFWKNIAPLIVGTIALVVVHVVFGILSVIFDSVVLQIIIRLIGYVVSLLVVLGLLRMALQVTAGESPDTNNLTNTNAWGTYIGASIIFAIVSSIGFALCIIPGIIVYVFWGFYGFVIADRGEGVGVGEAFSRSVEITAGNRWQLFGLGILLVLINFVGALLCGVGLLFTYGITAVTGAYAYRTLSGQPVAEVV